MSFLRRMVKGGRARKTAENGENSWALRMTNHDILRITGTQTASAFCEKQRLKYLAHVSRMPNNSYPKQTTFAVPTRPYHKCEWARISQRVGLDQSQIKRLMFNRNEFRKWLDSRYDDHPAKHVKKHARAKPR